MIGTPSVLAAIPASWVAAILAGVAAFVAFLVWLGRPSAPMSRKKAWWLLKTGKVAEWNRRRQAGARVPDMSGADLHGAFLWGADLSGLNLSGADLSYADLCDANLEGASCVGANFRCADLRSANLKDADLAGADFWYANMKINNVWAAKNLAEGALDDAHTKL